jgi:hypothetical protein
VVRGRVITKRGAGGALGWGRAYEQYGDKQGDAGDVAGRLVEGQETHAAN